MRWQLNPQTLKKIDRFKKIKVGYASFLVLAALSVLLATAELWVNNRALIVSYDETLYFPTYGAFIPGSTFDLGYDYETNYRDLKAKLEASQRGWVILPLVPYNPFESDARDGILRPTPPDPERGHFLGTDTTSRDILARLVYGTRTALLFALAFMISVYFIGVIIGCSMGYFGGAFDLIFQRFIEIWSNVPFLYMVIIVFSIIPIESSVAVRVIILLVVMVLFSWTSMTYYMRTETYKEKSRDYVQAARVLGAGTLRIIFRHILPNVLATLVTFMPFTIVSAISAVTALDFLGFGLPVPTPSLGELLKQGTGNLRTAPWIVISAFTTLVMLLTIVTFIGEAIRESFDPKKYTLYR